MYNFLKPFVNFVLKYTIYEEISPPSTSLENVAKELAENRKTCLTILLAYLALELSTGGHPDNSMALLIGTGMLFTLDLRIRYETVPILNLQNRIDTVGARLFAIENAIPSFFTFVITIWQLVRLASSPWIAIATICAGLIPTIVTVVPMCYEGLGRVVRRGVEMMRNLYERIST